MGNLSDQEKKTGSMLFIETLESSYMDGFMVQEMIDRWHEDGKPLFMLAKDFKDKILLNMDMEIKLNYYKWLSSGNEIDIFEILSILIIYSKCDL